MSVGFGFSVGDFIAAIKLLWNIVDAVKECGESTAEYRGLIEDLWHLENAFTQVTRLEFDECLASERDALKKAAEHVGSIIKRFNDKTQKFKKPLSMGNSGSKVQNSWKKVQWALFKKEDVARFREQLRDCTGTINLLITTAQMKITVLERRDRQQQRSSIAAILHEHCLRYLEQYQSVKREIAELVDTTRNILVLNKQMFQLIAKNDANTVGLPAQVELQPPVILLDAFGLRAPFHLDSITSADGLFNFLSYRFRSAGVEKIENGEFVLEEINTSRRVDLEQPWETCFVPGETIRMYFIIFGRKHIEGSRERRKKACPPPLESSCRVEEIEDVLPSEEASASVLDPSSFDMEAMPLARRLKRKYNIAFDEGLPKRHALGALFPRPKCPDWRPHASDTKLLQSLYSTLTGFHEYTDENVASHIMVKHKD